MAQSHLKMLRIDILTQNTAAVFPNLPDQPNGSQKKFSPAIKMACGKRSATTMEDTIASSANSEENNHWRYGVNRQL